LGIARSGFFIGESEVRSELRNVSNHLRKLLKFPAPTPRAECDPFIGWLAWLVPGSKPPEQKDIKEASTYLVPMLLQPMGAKETQIRFKMQKGGDPVWDQTTIDRLWVTTQREAMIESGPPPAAAANPQPSGASEQKVQKEQRKSRRRGHEAEIVTSGV